MSTTQTKYTPEIRGAVKFARSLHAKNPALEGQRAGAASAGQHVRVRARVTELIDGPVTPDAIVRLAGVRSQKALAEIASYSTGKEALVALRPLSKGEFGDDAWCQGRYLAGILAAWIAELRSVR